MAQLVSTGSRIVRYQGKDARAHVKGRPRRVMMEKYFQEPAENCNSGNGWGPHGTIPTMGYAWHRNSAPSNRDNRARITIITIRDQRKTRHTNPRRQQNQRPRKTLGLEKLRSNSPPPCVLAHNNATTPLKACSAAAAHGHWLVSSYAIHLVQNWRKLRARLVSVHHPNRTANVVADSNRPQASAIREAPLPLTVILYLTQENANNMRTRRTKATSNVVLHMLVLSNTL